MRLHSTSRIRRHIVVQAAVFTIGMLMVQPMFAQTIAVSQEVTLRNDQAYYIIGKFDETILLMRDQETEVEIHAFDDELHQKWQRTIEYEKKNTQVFSVVETDTSFHVLYGYRDKGDYFIRHRHYRPDLSIIDSLEIEQIKDLFFAPRIVTIISEDRTKVLIFRVDKETELNASVYDLNTSEIMWSKQMLFQEGSLRRDFRKLLLSDAGEMILIMDHERNSQRNKQFNIYHIGPGDRTVYQNTVDLGGLLAFDLHAEYDNLNNTLWLAGLYSEKTVGKLLGIYTLRIGLDEDDPRSRIIQFDEALLEELSGTKSGKKKGVQDFIIRDIVLREDGGAVLFAEMSKEYSRRPSAPTRTVDYGRAGWVDYYFEDVVVFSINPDGSEHWRTVLHKKQYSQDDDGMYSSFFTFKTPEKLRLLFNDEIRQNNTVSEYVIRGNGYHKRSSVFSTDYQRLRLRFKDAVQVAYNECIVPSERSNRLNLVRITFDE